MGHHPLASSRAVGPRFEPAHQGALWAAHPVYEGEGGTCVYSPAWGEGAPHMASACLRLAPSFPF